VTDVERTARVIAARLGPYEREQFLVFGSRERRKNANSAPNSNIL
jgi:hypothetical protein